MNVNPLVSVIIPSYNYAHLIRRCIHSVIDQTYTNWELIIGDDKSQDNSLEILAEYSRQPNIKILVNEQTLGIYGNIAKCIQQATGDYIKILMADDWLHPDYLTKTLALFEEYPSIGLCSVRTDVIRSGETWVSREEPERGRRFYPSTVMLDWTTRHINPIGNPSRVIFRWEAYEQLGGFDLDIEYCTEYELWIRILEHWDCGFVTETLSFEQAHDYNATKKYVTDARHLLTGEQMFLKLFHYHSYFRKNWWRQQRVWVWGWQDYWNTAIRHFFKGQRTELKVLAQILYRNVPVWLWLPYLLMRFLAVSICKTRFHLSFNKLNSL